MLIPNISSYDTTEKSVTLFLDKPEELQASYHILSEKDRLKLIRETENLVRSSLEYKQLVAFLKSEVDMTKCSFFQNVSSKTSKVSIEIHHHPFTLFDIVVTIINKYEDEGKELNPLMIADEVIKIHYTNMVGLIPLSKTVHQLAHDGKVFIPLQYVYGEYTNFLIAYDKWIPEPVKGALKVLLDMSKDSANLDLSILKPKYVYIEVDGFQVPSIISREETEVNE